MKIKTSELTDAALDWAVARAKGIPAEELYIQNWGSVGKSIYRRNRDEDGKLDGTYTTGPDMLFSRKWEAGGPIVERELDMLVKQDSGQWLASVPNPKVAWYLGPTLLIATMRCYVASKLGDVVEVPEELL